MPQRKKPPVPEWLRQTLLQRGITPGALPGPPGKCRHAAHMAVQPLRLRNLYQARRCDAGHLKTGVLFDDCWEPVSCASAALSR